MLPTALGNTPKRRSRLIVTSLKSVRALVQSPCSAMRTRPVCGLSIVNVLSALTARLRCPALQMRCTANDVGASTTHHEEVVAEQLVLLRGRQLRHDVGDLHGQAVGERIARDEELRDLSGPEVRHARREAVVAEPDRFEAEHPEVARDALAARSHVVRFIVVVVTVTAAAAAAVDVGQRVAHAPGVERSQRGRHVEEARCLDRSGRSPSATERRVGAEKWSALRIWVALELGHCLR